MINLSPAATNEIKRLKSQQQTNTLVRLRVQPGGCSDWFYDISFDQSVKLTDHLFELQGIKIVIDGESLNYLDGLTVDYSEDLMGGAFRFHNPMAIAACSCGNSFAVN
jgi:iron-sulfur cluster assembly accessory protein